MFARIILVLLCSAILSACTDTAGDSTQPKLKQEAHTSPMGQTTYSYRPVDGTAQ
ncbi:MAG: hypothetical protein ACAI37_23295 [Chthoniobacter sp.]